MPLPDPKDVMTILGFSLVLIVWFIIIFLLVFALTACGAIRIEGECVYSREITVTYACEPGGKLEGLKTQPPD